jgi:hypothetical protein
VPQVALQNYEGISTLFSKLRIGQLSYDSPPFAIAVYHRLLGIKRSHPDKECVDSFESNSPLLPESVKSCSSGGKMDRKSKFGLMKRFPT